MGLFRKYMNLLTQTLNVGVIGDSPQGLVLRFPVGFYSFQKVLQRWESAKYIPPFLDMDGDQLMQVIIPWEVARLENISLSKPYQWTIDEVTAKPSAWKHNAPFNSQFLGAQRAQAGQDY
jgi:hypothetical protein